VHLLYLKKEGDLLYSITDEQSWESTEVIVGVMPNPEIDPLLSRRKITYRFPK
jgi:hypothetical protein